MSTTSQNTFLIKPEDSPEIALKKGVSHVTALCRQARKRLHRKLEKQEMEHAAAGSWEQMRQFGDVILANIALLRKGQTTAELTNAHTGKTEFIPLNPTLNPQDNAQLYYRKAKKGKRGFESTSEYLLHTRTELADIDRALARLDQLAADVAISAESGLEHLEQITDSIPLVVPQTRKPTALKAPQVEKIPYRHFTFEGWDIFVGRNNTQNDELSTRFAKPWDIWLHVAAHPGSHVVIRRQKNTEWPPKQVIETAASFAVWFSKAKHTTYAEVHVTERRFVSKRRGSPPGQVMVQQFKSVRVAPRCPQEFFKSYSEGDGDDWG